MTDRELLEHAAGVGTWHGGMFDRVQRLADHNGKIIGEVFRSSTDNTFTTNKGDRYISSNHARKAVELAAAAMAPEEAE